jgi:hypothetical protein
MKSLAGATHVLIEEADEVGEAEFDQLDLSLRTTKTEGDWHITELINAFSVVCENCAIVILRR